MAYYEKAFSEQSIAMIAKDINDFLVANPTFVSISVSNTLEGAGCYATLVYSTP